MLTLLRELYAAATGSSPRDRGCFPGDGSRLRVGVDERRVYPPE